MTSCSCCASSHVVRRRFRSRLFKVLKWRRCGFLTSSARVVTESRRGRHYNSSFESVNVGSAILNIVGAVSESYFENFKLLTMAPKSSRKGRVYSADEKMVILNSIKRGESLYNYLSLYEVLLYTYSLLIR